MARKCDKTDCVNHDKNNEGVNHSNGCVALSTLYKKNEKCKFYKEKKDE